MEHETEDSENRVATFLELSQDQQAHNVGWGIVYDERFRSEEWPRTAYSLTSTDLQAVLEKLGRMRVQRAAAELRADRLAEELAQLREKLGRYQQQEIRELLMEIPEGRKLLFEKAEKEEATAREAEAAFWAQMPTTTEEENAGE